MRFVEAAIRLLKTHGARGMTARAVAAEAGHNQALIYYHFGGLEQLMVAALEEVSRLRLGRYEPLLAGPSDPTQLIATVRHMFLDDVSEGWVKVLVEVMVSGISSPYLSAEVARLLEPWISVAESAIDRFPVIKLTGLDPRHAALICVALFVGLDVLSQLDSDPLAITETIEGSASAVDAMAQLLGVFGG